MTRLFEIYDEYNILLLTSRGINESMILNIVNRRLPVNIVSYEYEKNVDTIVDNHHMNI